MTVEELLERITSTELTEWQAFEQVEGPLGQRRDDHLAVLTAFYVAAAFGAEPRFDRMLPQWDRPPASWEHMKSVAVAVTRAMGGTVEEEGQ